MNLISAEDEADILSAMQDLWDTLQQEVIVVKEPQVSVSNLTDTYIPGFGQTPNPSNFTPEPLARTFYCLTIDRRPEGQIDVTTLKLSPTQVVYLQVQEDARNFINDGKTLHVILDNLKYNVVSEEAPIPLLSKPYFLFKLELIR